MSTVRDEFLNTIGFFPLAFKDPGVESGFRDFQFDTNLAHGRLCHFLAIVFFVADGIRDRAMFADALTALMIIRYAYIVPVFMAGLAFSYISPQMYRRCWQPLFACYVLITGAGALAMTIVVPPPFGSSLYVGVIYCLIFGYTFIRLRFMWAAASGLILTGAYIAVSLWVTRVPVEVIWIQFPFVIGVNLLGMFVAYHLDYTARRGYFLRESLRVEKEKVDAVNDELERRVAERTEALEIANKTLQRNIDALRQSELARRELETHLTQAHKMEAIGTLAGGIAHDFNNILASVIGYTELALEEVAKGGFLEDSLRKVLAAGNRAKELVKQILTFARQSDEDVKPVQVAKIADEVLKLIRASIPVTIDIQKSIECDAVIMGNATQIHQIFMNLCTNAAQAMESDGGVLSVGLKEVGIATRLPAPFEGLGRGRYLKISVSDTGHGIDGRIAESIFEPYFTTRPPGEGTGMGLALVHGIVESYGGRIGVQSQVGKGTTFTIYLPTIEPHVLAASEVNGVLPTGSECILFVDDEAAITAMMARVLGNLGYRVSTRTSSVEALALFRSRPGDFDLVITDMTMPDMTGDALTAALRGIRSDIPVILCTGYNKRLSSARVDELGISALVYKPIVKKDLARTVRNILDARAGDAAV